MKYPKHVPKHGTNWAIPKLHRTILLPFQLQQSRFNSTSNDTHANSQVLKELCWIYCSVTHSNTAVKPIHRGVNAPSHLCQHAPAHHISYYLFTTWIPWDIHHLLPHPNLLQKLSAHNTYKVVTIIRCPTKVTRCYFLCATGPANRGGCQEENGQIDRTFGLTKAETCTQQVSTSKPKFRPVLYFPLVLVWWFVHAVSWSSIQFYPEGSIKNKPVRRKPLNSYLKWTSGVTTSIRLRFSPYMLG